MDTRKALGVPGSYLQCILPWLTLNPVLRHSISYVTPPWEQTWPSDFSSKYT